jgi:hypothetical protein
MRPTEPFRDEHRELVEHVEHLAEAARRMPTLSRDERDALRERVLGFLRGTLLPHAAAEEQVPIRNGRRCWDSPTRPSP